MSLPTPTELGSLDYVGPDGLPDAMISFATIGDQLDYGNEEGLPAALAAAGGPAPAGANRPVIVFMM